MNTHALNCSRDIFTFSSFKALFTFYVQRHLKDSNKPYTDHLKHNNKNKK